MNLKQYSQPLLVNLRFQYKFSSNPFLSTPPISLRSRCHLLRVGNSQRMFCVRTIFVKGNRHCEQGSVDLTVWGNLPTLLQILQRYRVFFNDFILLGPVSIMTCLFTSCGSWLKLTGEEGWGVYVYLIKVLLKESSQK